MNKDQTLSYIKSLDMGVSKIVRLLAYYRLFFEIHPNSNVTRKEINKIIKLSRKHIVIAKHEIP